MLLQASLSACTLLAFQNLFILNYFTEHMIFLPGNIPKLICIMLVCSDGHSLQPLRNYFWENDDSLGGGG